MDSRLIPKKHLAAALLGLASLAAGCQSPRHGGGEPAIVIALSGDTANAQPVSFQFTRIGRFISGSLLRPDARGVWHPQVAESVEAAADGRSLRVKVRDGAIFGDGLPVTADDVAASLNAHADPKFEGQYSGVLQGNGYAGARAVDDRTVHIEFRAPWYLARDCVAQLSIWQAPLLARIAADPKNVLLSLVPGVPGATHVVGAGPYRVVRYEKKVYAELEPVGAGEPILVRILGDDAALTAFREGSVDLAFAETRRQPLFARSTGGKTRLLTYPYPELATLATNARPGTPTGDHAALRRAIFLTIAPEALRKLVGGTEPAGGRIWGQLNEFNAPDAATLDPGHDPALANRILDEAGFTLNAQGLRTMPDHKELVLRVVTYTDVTEYPILVDAIADDLRRLLKIDARPSAFENERFEALMNGQDVSTRPDLIISEWPFQLGDFQPSKTNSVHSRCIPVAGGGGGQNWIGLSDPVVDDFCQKVEGGRDPVARKSAMVAIHKRLLEESRVKPLYLPVDAWAVGPRVGGIDSDDPYAKLTIFRWPERLVLKHQPVDPR